MHCERHRWNPHGGANGAGAAMSRELPERIAAIKKPAARWQRLPEKARAYVREILMTGANNPFAEVAGVTHEQAIDAIATVGAMLEQAEAG